MKIERTMETSAVVTPKLAMASRTQTTSYTSPQKPEITKNAKNQGRYAFVSASVPTVRCSVSTLENGIIVDREFF
jgi:hypothetical protein